MACGAAPRSPTGWLKKQASLSTRNGVGTICAGWSIPPQVPRPRHYKADPEAQADFKKTLSAFVAESEATYPASVVELWAFDQHRIGLLPLVRKVWAKKGSRPVRIVETRYQWLYL